MSAPRRPPERRSGFAHMLVLQTRWMDNDAYGHVNNVVYYSYFDTLVNRWLIDEGGFDILRSPVIGYAIETACRFHRPFAYPEPIEACLRVGHLGRSSVRYELGLFGVGENEARADGHFVHVFVDRATERPAPIPERIRASFERLRVGS
ncbi:MAG: acyl-CoA thioesterase [Alphaproteobacteria bacterium]|nr:acyl-CoA thioesterase [Alphaproteobacteria bacterium]